MARMDCGTRGCEPGLAHGANDVDGLLTETASYLQRGRACCAAAHDHARKCNSDSSGDSREEEKEGGEGAEDHVSIGWLIRRSWRLGTCPLSVH
jgi:hypothetical protein